MTGYAEFLASKAVRPVLAGPQVEASDIHPFLHPWQQLIVAWAVKRNRSGALCGYVGVAEGHPWFGVGYDDVRTAGGDYPDAHGGLTFADFCQDGDEAQTICHVPGPGEPDRVWWLGFDCAHAWDLVPGMRADMAGLGLPGHDLDETYRTVAYVKAECSRLAEQAAAAVPA